MPTKHAPLRLTTVSARLKYALDLRGMRAADLCRKSGLWPTTVSKIKRGEAEDPLCSTALAICRALQISIWWLIEGRGEIESASGLPPAYDRELLRRVTAVTAKAIDGRDVPPETQASMLIAFYEAAMESGADEPSEAVVGALARLYLDDIQH